MTNDKTGVHPSRFGIFFFILLGLVAGAFWAFPELRHKMGYEHNHEAEVESGDHDHEAEMESGDHDHEAEMESGDHDHDAETESGDHDHEAETESGDHDHEAETETILLDNASLFNIGIEPDDLISLTPQNYSKAFWLPGIVQDIPGRSKINLTASVSGTVTRIDIGQGEALCPGGMILEIMLTHEDAVQCQTELINLLQKRDVLAMEEKRLGSLSEGVAPKSQRELLLQKITNDAEIQSQRNLLKIHGFTDEMIDETVVAKRQTITHLIVRVPDVDGTGLTAQTTEQHVGEDHHEHYLILERMRVNKGDSVQKGDLLCQISDLRNLQIEGRAFAQDESVVNQALVSGSPVSALFPDPVTPGKSERIDHLRLVRVDNRIDQESQTVSGWVPLPNERLQVEEKEASATDCDKTIHWRFKPGQRCELAITQETIPDCFILPPEAVATNRGGAFVFELTDVHEDHRGWTKRSVRVLDRSPDAVAIAMDETIHAGMKIAAGGADQLLVAMGAGGGKLQSACEHDHSH